MPEMKYIVIKKRRRKKLVTFFKNPNVPQLEVRFNEWLVSYANDSCQESQMRAHITLLLHNSYSLFFS